MDSWEYLVIHINVEPPKAAAPGAAADAPATEAPGSREGGNARIFSESFLKQEFPHRYQGGAGERGVDPPQQHPAQQLQGFLNGHGSQGWELIGVFPVWVLSMLIFRRSKLVEPQAKVSLEALNSRLEALERRLLPEPATPLQQTTARTSSEADLLSPAQLASWATEATLPSRPSACALPPAWPTMAPVTAIHPVSVKPGPTAWWPFTPVRAQPQVAASSDACGSWCPPNAWRTDPAPADPAGGPPLNRRPSRPGPIAGSRHWKPDPGRRWPHPGPSSP